MVVSSPPSRFQNRRSLSPPLTPLVRITLPQTSNSSFPPLSRHFSFRPLPERQKTKDILSVAIGSFAIRDPYLPIGVLEEEDKAGLDIDSNVSDADLLDSKRELEKFGTERARRDLADTMSALQDLN